MTLPFRICLITDKQAVNGQALLEKVEEALKGGVRAVQMREKDLSAKEQLSLALRLRELTARYGAKLIINDRADIAMLAGADGVHLGQSSFSAKEARGLLGPDRVIGVSTHNIIEAEKAEKDGADFITFGPVYFTTSKAAYGLPVGLGLLKEVSSRVKVPVFALGGIKKENVKEVLGAGAFGIATISAILASVEATQSAKGLIEAVKDH